MRKLKIAYRGYGNHSVGVNGFGGGEHRYNANSIHFLETEYGHEIIPVENHPLIKDVACDLVYDPPFEGRGCRELRTPKHIHMRFGPLHTNYESEECASSGDCVIVVPWKEAYAECLKFDGDYHDKVHPLYLPLAYPDDLLPASSAVPGFERNEVFWGTKDMFHPTFAEGYLEGEADPSIRKDSHGWKIVNAGLCTLKALLRLEKRVDFKMNFVMAHHLKEAPDHLGVLDLVNSFKNKSFQGIAPWRTSLIETMSRCKLNVPIGGLWGSSPEAIFTGCLPMIHPNNMFYADFDIMPEPIDLTEDVLYDIFERHWFDKDVYNTSSQRLQERFEDHRTPGLRKHYADFFEYLGLD